MSKKLDYQNKLFDLSDISEDLSELFYEVLRTEVLDLYQNINSWSEFKKELAKIKSKFYKETDKYFTNKLWFEVKSKIDTDVKKIKEILYTVDLNFDKKMKKLDNSSDSIDILQELINRFVEINDILISKIKLPDVLKYLHYIKSRAPKLSPKEKNKFDQNMKNIKDAYKTSKIDLYKIMNQDNLLKYIFGIK